MFIKKTLTALSVAALSLYSTSALSSETNDINSIKSELKQMKSLYESRIRQLESKLSKLENVQRDTEKKVEKVESDLPDLVAQSSNNPVLTDQNRRIATIAGRNIYDNSFNPSIGLVLNGQYVNRSESFEEIDGFATGEEGHPIHEGVSVDHTEMNFSANIDDKFRGSVTAAIAEHDGDTEIELEEAFFETLPGFGLPQGLSIKGGRALWEFGYLNANHVHTDDFADRPLTHRVFLNEAFNDDGVQVSYILPTNFYGEIGGGYYKGQDFPAGGANGEEANTYSAYIRTGGDIGDNGSSYRIGFSALMAEEISREGNHGEIRFDGESNLYAIDAKTVFRLNPQQEIVLQGEYFWREEDGDYVLDADTMTPTAVGFDDSQSGWYTQAIFKFNQQWRAGYRYTALDPVDSLPVGLVGSELDAGGHTPEIHTVMVDWTNSEFSRIRAQYNYDKSVNGITDNQFILQYIMSIGAHGAHNY
jgi:hypothetical protein